MVNFMSYLSSSNIIIKLPEQMNEPVDHTIDDYELLCVIGMASLAKFNWSKKAKRAMSMR